MHAGQFLETGTQLTTLQGVDGAANVDFAVAQSVAASLKVGEQVQIIGTNESTPITARVVAVDARVDPTTRNAAVRARIDDLRLAPAPGASGDPWELDRHATVARLDFARRYRKPTIHCGRLA